MMSNHPRSGSNSMLQHQQRHHQHSNPLFREIHKNAWLTCLPTVPNKKKKERYWMVFCVHDDTEAFLEAYVDKKTAALHKPEWTLSLNTTRHISSTICPNDQEYEFVLTLPDTNVRLAAPSWDQMLDWITSLRNKLLEMHILMPNENLYSKAPEGVSTTVALVAGAAVTVHPNTTLPSSRDPTSPLPAPPVHSIHETPPAGLEPVGDVSEIAANSTSTSWHPRLQRGISLPETSTPATAFQIPEADESNAPASATANSRDFFNFQNLNQLTLSEPDPLPTSTHSTPTPPSQENEADSRYVSVSNCVTAGSNLDTPPASSATAVITSHRQLQPPPQSYKTLREQQVFQLQQEMTHTGGVRLQIRRKDCISSIALADAMDAVWICGWNQREHPILYNALHIGDQLVSIEGGKVRNAGEALQILKTGCNKLYVTIVVNRVPRGRVYVLRREYQGQPLGIEREGNTATIREIPSDGLAARQGMESRTRANDGHAWSQWVITEVNGRPLNLFFKDGEVRDRLNAVGLEISILVQPADLVRQLKKQLKSLRNYKDYILQ